MKEAKSPTVLVVDDDKAMRILLSRFARRAGFDVVEAADGREALEQFERAPPQVVLVDAVMPGLDGFGLTARLRERPDGHDIPVIMVTALQSSEVVSRAFAAGVTEFIEKPPEPEILINRLRLILRAQTAQRALSLAAKVFECTGEAILVTDAAGLIVDVNPAFCAITGFDAGEVVGRNPSIMKSGHHDAQFYAEMWRALREEGCWHGEVWDRRKNGEVYPKWLTVNAVADQAGATTHYVGIFSDITVVKQTEERLERLAHYDPLTGLPNRLLLQDRIRQGLQSARRKRAAVALLLLDLDRFKVINDSLGHAAGDQLLVQVAGRIGSAVRKTDTAARLAGDEFTVLLTDLPHEAMAEQITRKVLEAFRDPFRLGDHSVRMSPSIGVALFPACGGGADALLKAADTAMYEAKRAGRNTYRIYSKRAGGRVSEQLRLEKELQEALERRDLRVHYQPQVDLQSRQLVGAEALLRWQHRRHGLLGPDRFLPLAEDSGLILPIGEWVIGEACRQLAAWQRQANHGLRVAVNVAARQLKQADFVERLEALIRQSGIEPGRLELELNESILLRELDRVIEPLRQLKELGVRLVVDQFGAGYTSLTRLRGLPVDALKVDHTLLRDRAGDTPEGELAEAVIGMARSLRFAVVSSGVETAEQAGFMRAQQCTSAQGYYFGHPLPPERFARLLTASPK